jgi:hypothetical protein
MGADPLRGARNYARMNMKRPNSIPPCSLPCLPALNSMAMPFASVHRCVVLPLRAQPQLLHFTHLILLPLWPSTNSVTQAPHQCVEVMRAPHQCGEHTYRRTVSCVSTSILSSNTLVSNGKSRFFFKSVWTMMLTEKSDLTCFPY